VYVESAERELVLTRLSPLAFVSLMIVGYLRMIISACWEEIESRRKEVGSLLNSPKEL